MMDLVSLTIDVEWAATDVLADLVRLLDDRGLRATFFCTHDGVSVDGHERGLHPNFRWQGDTMRQMRREAVAQFDALGDEEIYRRVIDATRAFCPEAIGVRAHSLFYDSLLLRLYRESGLQYDSTYALPLMTGLSPFRKEFDIVELPIYYNDHFDLKAQATNFELSALRLDAPGLKVFNFHPNLVFLNAGTDAHYQESKPHYHDVKRLLATRFQGRGVRTLFLDLLDTLAEKPDRVKPLGEINRWWREQQRAGA
jgi:hypothetical protein